MTEAIPWWRLAESVPEAVRGLTNQLGWALLVGGLLGGLSGKATLFWFGVGFGGAAGMLGWPTGKHGGAIAFRATMGGLFSLAVAAFFQPWIGAVVAVGFAILVWLGYGWRMALAAGLTGLATSGLVMWIGSMHAAMVLFGAVLAVAAGAGYWLVFAGLRQRPSRVRLHLRGTWKPALRRFAAGFGVSLFGTLVVAVTGAAGLGIAAAMGVATGLAAASTVWLDTPGDTEEPQEVSLRRDRTAALSSAVLVGSLIGAGLWLSGVLFTRYTKVTAFGAADVPPVAVAAGLAAALAVAASRSWGGYVAARAWFALRGSR